MRKPKAPLARGFGFGAKRVGLDGRSLAAAGGAAAFLAAVAGGAAGHDGSAGSPNAGLSTPPIDSPSTCFARSGPLRAPVEMTSLGRDGCERRISRCGRRI